MDHLPDLYITEVLDKSSEYSKILVKKLTNALI